MPVTAEQLPDGTFRFHGRSFKQTEDKNAALAPFHKQIYYYGLKLSVLPVKEEEEGMNQQIGNARFVHNLYFNERNEYYKANKRILSVTEYKKSHLPERKKEYPFLKKSDKFALENALECLDQAYTNFYEGRAGFPKPWKKNRLGGDRYTTKETNGNIDLVIEDDIPRIKLPKVGHVRFIMPKGQTLATLKPKGVSILKATIIRTRDGKFEISLLMQAVIDEIKPVVEMDYSDIVGMDLGLHDFCILGDGIDHAKIANPRWIKLHEKRLRRFKKSLSRKQYDKKTHTGSRNWEKARKRVAKEEKKTANQRHDFHHKLSLALAETYSVVVCEDLNVKGMMKNHRLAKSVASVGWSSFLTLLRYKLERRGKHLVKVSRWFASSQTCHVCGYKNPEVKDLSVREWDCPSCGTHLDRDGNAAFTIKAEGIRVLLENGYVVYNGQTTGHAA
ncbi:MAG: RNA-guided endonuclease TnpB family protein [Lachnospiraceae bacterium]|nr:RNA-guided endonuclease TnpB family protein [Lachnospiraceae bacterium]